MTQPSRFKYLAGFDSIRPDYVPFIDESEVKDQIMPGITILSKSKIIGHQSGTGLIWGVISFILLLGLWIHLIIVNKGFMAFRGIAFLLALIIGIAVEKRTMVSYATGRFKYHVLMDDSVSFQDFIDKYNYVGRDGLIYIIEDKETEE